MREEFEISMPYPRMNEDFVTYRAIMRMQRGSIILAVIGAVMLLVGFLM